ncbi:EamA family transporter [Paractinoplanes bogorensis]|uniref:EamA family transporter n=1 Tax=Paractinoplanes bogorensis TaxID=1610840 RepID=UPI001FEA951D|nr:EamA family transporter [Actinoplanes bogorensis]
MTSAAFAAASWGISDFLAGLLARRLPILTILVWSKVAAMLLALLAAAVRAAPPPMSPRLWLAVLAGLVGLPAMGLLYRAMRDGSLALVAPVAAIAALVPVGWGVMHGERLGLLATLGVAAGLAGATMASWPVEPAQRRRHRTASLCALGAALGFGVYFVLLHEAAEADQFWSVVVARVAEGLAALLLAGRRLWVSASSRWPRLISVSSRLILVSSRRLPRPPGNAADSNPPGGVKTACPQALSALSIRTAVPIFVVGATDAIADAAFIAAAAAALAPAAVVASLYPAVTLLLTRSLLRERLHTVHLCGVLAALFAVACLAR